MSRTVLLGLLRLLLQRHERYGCAISHHLSHPLRDLLARKVDSNDGYHSKKRTASKKKKGIFGQSIDQRQRKSRMTQQIHTIASSSGRVFEQSDKRSLSGLLCHLNIGRTFTTSQTGESAKHSFSNVGSADGQTMRKSKKG